MIIPETVEFLRRSDKPDLAYCYTPAQELNKDKPCIVFCGGFKSDMMGSKALYLEEKCRQEGYGFLRFDYSGHGFSSGSFEEGTIGIWRDDALAVFDHLGLDKILLIGSSMGGWISLLIAREQPQRIQGLIGIAAAPDFTDDIYYNRISEEHRMILNHDGRVELPNDYSDEPYIITKALIDDGRENFVIDTDKDLQLLCPVNLLQGKEDEDVPWEWAENIRKKVTGSNVSITYIADGDHRLSRDQDLIMIWNRTCELLAL